MYTRLLREAARDAQASSARWYANQLPSLLTPLPSLAHPLLIPAHPLLNPNSRYAEQGMLNDLFADNWTRLPASYNVQGLARHGRVDEAVDHFVHEKAFMLRSSLLRRLGVRRSDTSLSTLQKNA